MEDARFDGLVRAIGRGTSRRGVLRGLLGTAFLGTVPGIAAAKREPNQPVTPRGNHAGKRHARARAQAKNNPGNHCITPGGQDLNLLYGITAQIVAPFCTQVGSGEQWVNTRGWTMEHAFVAVPPGFTPAGATPLEDFIAKFEGVRYVIDPGTPHEQTVVIPNSDALFTGEDAGLVLVSPGTLSTLHPLPVGRHTFDLYWALSAMHCDGIVANVEENCLPAGDTPFIEGLEIDVTPGHHSRN